MDYESAQTYGDVHKSVCGTVARDANGEASPTDGFM